VNEEEERPWLILGRRAEERLRMGGDAGRTQAAADFVEACRQLGHAYLDTLERRWHLEDLSREDLPELARQLHQVLTDIDRRGQYRRRWFYFDKVQEWPALHRKEGLDEQGDP
jgi:hypothetical protein